MLIKKNSPVYNKYRNEQNTKLYIESICLISFEIMVEVVSGKDSSEKMTRFYDIIPGQLLEVDFENYLILHNLG